MYFLLGQDYRSSVKPPARSWFRSGTKLAGSSERSEEWEQDVDAGYAANEELLDDSFDQAEDVLEWPSEADLWDEEAMYQDKPGCEEDEVLEEAYASYLDARKKFA